MVSDKKLSFRIERELWVRLVDYCQAHGMKPSAVIRAALVAFLK